MAAQRITRSGQAGTASIRRSAWKLGFLARNVEPTAHMLVQHDVGHVVVRCPFFQCPAQCPTQCVLIDAGVRPTKPAFSAKVRGSLPSAQRDIDRRPPDTRIEHSMDRTGSAALVGAIGQQAFELHQHGMGRAAIECPHGTTGSTLHAGAISAASTKHQERSLLLPIAKPRERPEKLRDPQFGRGARATGMTGRCPSTLCSRRSPAAAA